MYAKTTVQQRKADMDAAREYLAHVYLNTGCEESEAWDFAQNFHADNPEQIYCEACRYEDM